MTPRETVIPRALAILLLLVSLSMVVPISAAAISLLRGQPVRHVAYLVPLGILGTGWVLTLVLSRRPSSIKLYLAALALWLLTAISCLLHFDVF